jgi:glutaredoxin 3
MPKIEIYSTPNCGYCIAARRLLDRKGAPYAERNLSGDRSLRAEMIGRSGGRMTVPQIFIGDQHIGGYTDLAELDRRGQLDRLLAA